VDAHPDGTIFHRSDWRDLVRSQFGFRPHYFAAVEDDTIRGVLPLFLVPRPFGKRVLISVPFAVYGGILADDDETLRALLVHADQLLKGVDGHYLELRHREPRALDDLVLTDLYVTYVRNLPDAPEDCLGMLPRKARAAARNARTKFGLEAFDTLDMLERFHTLFLLNKRRLGSPCFSPAFFRKVVETHAGRVGLYNVMQEGRLMASVLYFVYRDTIYPYFMGEVADSRRVSASNFMYMALMEHAVRLGLTRFDFGRSRRGTGTAEFKEHQGFSPTPLSYGFRLHRAGSLPSNNPSNPKYDRAKMIWGRMPVAAARLLGPHLIRYFP
jgi:FemAB-related protein (PEP-CTERM system-associated)